MRQETDYLIIGCGASAMAFTDVILQETDATVTIVDRRHAPGGHWNDAYPFVKLHQPSASYGVASRALGRDKIDTSGFNSGFYELASGTEITHYFHDLMEDEFLPTGRVDYHPMSDYIGNGEFISLLSGERHQRKIQRKLVHGAAFDMEIPLTHQRKFEVAEGIRCIAPNDLTRAAPDFEHYTVLGGGKTAIDSVIWLLANGTPPSSISWVLPRDQWLQNRAYFQPGYSFFEKSIGGLATTYGNIAAATSMEDLCNRMEKAGMWLRLDSNVWPTMFHAATVSEAELEQLRLVPNLIRKGYVRRIESDKMILDQGEVSCEPSTLYIDCTARGIAAGYSNDDPVFGPTEISLKPVRMYQPTFSAALIGYIEATEQDEAVKQQMTQPVPMTDTVEDWVRAQLPNMANQHAWSRNEKIFKWILESRLDPLAKLVRGLDEDDSEKKALVSRLSGTTKAAVENLHRLAGNG